MANKELINIGLPKSAMPGSYPRLPTNILPKARHAVYMKRLWNESGYPWELVPYLVAESATERVLPAVSEATLRFRHGRLKPWDDTTFADFAARAKHDWYVCIMSTPENGRHWPLWCGIVPAHNFAVGASRRDGIDVIKHGEEHLHAYGLEWLLDRRRVVGAYTRNSNGSANLMQRMPAFNERLRRGPTFPGNRSEEKIEVGSEEVAYGFGSEVDEYNLPYQWSVVDIAEYLLHWSDPDSTYEPTFVFSAADGTGYDLLGYLDAVYPQVRQSDRSVLAILKMLFDRRGGYGARIKWVIETDSDSPDFGMPGGDVEVEAFSCVANAATVGSVTFPANPHKEYVVLDEGFDIVDANALVDSTNTYDRIVVRGAPVVSCFSLAASGIFHSPFEIAWDSATETAYRAEVTTEEAGGTVTADAKRNQEKYRRIYVGYRIPSDFTWVRPSGYTLNPVFNVNGEVSSWTLVAGYDNAHIRLLNWLPIPTQSSTLVESVEQNMQEPLAVLQVFVDDVAVNMWVMSNNIPPDIARSNKTLNARLIPNDREGLCEIRFNPKHILGRGYFDPDTDEHEIAPVFSYDNMILTVAVEAPSHPTVTVETLAPPILGPTPVPILERTLVIDVPDAQFWLVAPGTVVGISEHGTLQYHQTNRVTRDDTERLRVVAATAAAVYGRRRTAIRMTRRGLIGGGALGRVVESVTIAQEVHDVNSPVTERSWDFERGTTSLSTGWVELDVRAVR